MLSDLDIFNGVRIWLVLLGCLKLLLQILSRYLQVQEGIGTTFSFDIPIQCLESQLYLHEVLSEHDDHVDKAFLHPLVQWLQHGTLIEAICQCLLHAFELSEELGLREDVDQALTYFAEDRWLASVCRSRRHQRYYDRVIVC